MPSQAWFDLLKRLNVNPDTGVITDNTPSTLNNDARNGMDQYIKQSIVNAYTQRQQLQQQGNDMGFDGNGGQDMSQAYQADIDLANSIKKAYMDRQKEQGFPITRQEADRWFDRAYMTVDARGNATYNDAFRKAIAEQTGMTNVRKEVTQGQIPYEQGQSPLQLMAAASQGGPQYEPQMNWGAVSGDPYAGEPQPTGTLSSPTGPLSYAPGGSSIPTGPALANAPGGANWTPPGAQAQAQAAPTAPPTAAPTGQPPANKPIVPGATTPPPTGQPPASNAPPATGQAPPPGANPPSSSVPVIPPLPTTTMPPAVTPPAASPPATPPPSLTTIAPGANANAPVTTPPPVQAAPRVANSSITGNNSSLPATKPKKAPTSDSSVNRDYSMPDGAWNNPNAKPNNYGVSGRDAELVTKKRQMDEANSPWGKFVQRASDSWNVPVEERFKKTPTPASTSSSAQGQEAEYAAAHPTTTMGNLGQAVSSGLGYALDNFGGPIPLGNTFTDVLNNEPVGTAAAANEERKGPISQTISDWANLLGMVPMKAAKAVETVAKTAAKKPFGKPVKAKLEDPPVKAKADGSSYADDLRDRAAKTKDIYTSGPRGKNADFEPDSVKFGNKTKPNTLPKPGKPKQDMKPDFAAASAKKVASAVDAVKRGAMSLDDVMKRLSTAEKVAFREAVRKAK